jgi:hypothetical protein
MVDAQTISIIFAGLSIGVAAIYYTLTLSSSQRAQKLQIETRQAQLFMQTYHKWIDKDLHLVNHKVQAYEWEDFDDFMGKYGPEVDMDAYSDFTRILSYFEGIGVLIKRGLIDPYIVDDLMSMNIIRLWEKYEPLTISMREYLNAPQAGEWWEYLYNTIKPIFEEQHPELKT